VQIQKIGQKKNARRAVTSLESSAFHACGRSPEEHLWHFVQHIACMAKKPSGYDEVIVCRVGSKHCPALVDFSKPLENPHFSPCTFKFEVKI